MGTVVVLLIIFIAVTCGILSRWGTIFHIAKFFIIILIVMIIITTAFYTVPLAILFVLMFLIFGKRRY